MKKETKRQLEKFIYLLPKVNKYIKECIGTDMQQALYLIADSYDGILLMQHIAAESEGETHCAVVAIENYRQALEEVYGFLSENQLAAAKEKCEELFNTWTFMKEEISQIKEKLEVVFMPYKAAMWDSLESVWMAADSDPDCDAYVIPMPYYDRNPDHSLGTYHYEADLFPKYVPLTHYDEYDLEKRQPDVIYIHNPYDWANNATTVDTRFYSDKLKKYTKCLVYIPYYSTSGHMAEAQEKCLAYYTADYIVTQSEKYRKFFDPALPEKKFLPYGSPKFDRTIRICNNPPEPPADWKEKMNGKKVYFYNTSLGGMLGDTEKFFNKMAYVFDCFEGRKDACLLWRPHPLFESTIDSMRPNYRSVYDRLKQYFIEEGLGIFDDTPDITTTIALCDAYIGDSATSVTSLFGVAGKPMFLINNAIHHLPQEDDWKSGILCGFSQNNGDEYKVVQGNKLYRAKNRDYHYHYVCDLKSYSGGGYYQYTVFPYKDKHYICPRNAQDILVLKDGKIVEKIELVREVEQPGAFFGATILGEFLYLFPNKYPAIVRMNCETGNIQYIRGYNDIFVKWLPELGEWRIGVVAALPWDHYLKIYSPTKDEILVIDNKTGRVEITSLGVSHHCGCSGVTYDGTDWWFLPYTGRTITRWNEKSNQIWEYSDFPEEFVCTNVPHGYTCEDRPFAGIFFHKQYVYFSPLWGNVFLRLDKNTGKIETWEPFFPVQEKPQSDYFSNWVKGGYFDRLLDETGNGHCHFFTTLDAKLYDLDFNTQTYTEIPVIYDIEELHKHEAGFGIDSEWQRYCCWENVFNTLPDFLNGNISGNAFSKEAQLQSYAEINASCDGLCGQKVHQKVKSTVFD